MPAPIVDPGYRLATYDPADRALEQKWCEVLDKSGEFGTFTKKTLKSEILSTLLPRGGAFVFYGEELVACAAACSARQYDPLALLMFVVVLPEHRGKSLGAVVTLEVMSAALRAGRVGMLLHTDEHRLPAIKTYLKLGFVPETDWEPSARGRWEIVLERLGGSNSSPTHAVGEETTRQGDGERPMARRINVRAAEDGPQSSGSAGD